MGKRLSDVKRDSSGPLVAPENHRGRCSTGPDDGIEILGTRLIAPQDLLTCQSQTKITSVNEFVLSLGQIC
jgi:hypothetical protein